MSPSLRNLFMKKLTRDRVVPIISANVSWLISNKIGAIALDGQLWANRPPLAGDHRTPVTPQRDGNSRGTTRKSDSLFDRPSVHFLRPTGLSDFSSFRGGPFESA